MFVVQTICLDPTLIVLSVDYDSPELFEAMADLGMDVVRLYQDEILRQANKEA